MEPTLNITTATTSQKTTNVIEKPLYKKNTTLAKIIFCELWANLRYTIPYSLKWIWRCHISKTIKTEPLSGSSIDKKVTRVAFLNTHGKVDKNASSLLFCHGDFGHPFTELHLQDIAKNKKKNVFSLYIPHINDNQHFNVHDALLRQSIEKIYDLAPGKILGVGHSKGAILLAHRHFVQLDPHLSGVCAIAGRLRIPEVKEGEKADPKDMVDSDLRAIVTPIQEAIENHPERHLTQIVPKEDWNASQEGMMVRKGTTCKSVPGMHFSGLFTKETKQYFTDFIAEFS